MHHQRRWAVGGLSEGGYCGFDIWHYAPSDETVFNVAWISGGGDADAILTAPALFLRGAAGIRHRQL